MTILTGKPRRIGGAGGGGALGFTPVNKAGDTMTGPLKTDVFDLGGAVHNVKAYGATGNGTTDDTAPILTALAAAHADGNPPYFPDGSYLMSGIGTELLLLTKALYLIGAGLHRSIILVASSVGATTDVIRYAPPAGGLESWGFGVFGLGIRAQSGTPGRHALMLDPVTAGTFAYRIMVERCDWRQLGGRAIVVNNSGLVNPSVGYMTVARNRLAGGIWLNGGQDSILIDDNIIHGANVGVEADLITGAANLNIVNNTIVNAGGGVWIKRGAHPIIRGNYFEALAAYTNVSGNNAYLDIAGHSASRSLGPEIKSNQISILAAAGAVDAIRLDYTRDAEIAGNSIALETSGSTAIRTTANALGTVVGPNPATLAAGTTYLVNGGDAELRRNEPPRIYANVSDSTAIGNTTTETAFDKTYSIPANTLQVGDVIRVRAGGVISTDAAGTVAVTFRPKLGATQMAQSAITVTAGQSNASWRLESEASVRSLGTPSTVRSGGGLVSLPGGTTVLASIGTGTLNVTTTSALLVSISVQFASARAGDSIKIGTLTVEIVRPGATS